MFHDVDSMLDFVETVADATGPAGRHQVRGRQPGVLGRPGGRRWRKGGRGVDFVNVDGGEGGTGAAPMVFADSVAYPFRLGFAEVYRRFAAAGLADDVTFIGAGKLGLPENAVVAFALGADMVNVGREAMLAIGCIQAQKCHTDHCPVGIATQNPRYTRGLDPTLKSVRLANYVRSLRRDLLKVSEAVGVVHPGLISRRRRRRGRRAPHAPGRARGLRLRAGLGRRRAGAAARRSSALMAPAGRRDTQPQPT